MSTRFPTIVCLIIVLITVSCVPNRKVAYLQYENEFKNPDEIVMDSIVRLYESGRWGYCLQPNDLVDIKIASLTPEDYNPFHIADRYLLPGSGSNINQQNQSVGYRIDPAGYLNLPILGRIKAAGLTLIALEDTINNRALSQLEEPVTKVNILNYKFSVIGEVNSESTLFSSDNALTMLQALSFAGGPSEFGDISRIKVIRWMDGQNFVFYVNLLDEKFLSSEFYFTQPNDVIVVTPLKSRSYLKYVGPNLSIFTASISLLLSILTLYTVFK